MHLNSEIRFLNDLSNNMFVSIFGLQPRDSGSSSVILISREETIKQLIEELQDKIPDEFHMTDIMTRFEQRTPYVVVVYQECERMNQLTTEMRRSLRELMLGHRGELTITQEMELLDDCITFDRVPMTWTRLAYPSTLLLTQWFSNLLHRHQELSNWSIDFSLPICVWLPGLFNPQVRIFSVASIGTHSSL